MQGHICINIVSISYGVFHCLSQHKYLFTLGVPGEITENLKKLKHAITESKYKSKGVPTLEIIDELSKAVSDMGFITPILKSLMVPVI